MTIFTDAERRAVVSSHPAPLYHQLYSLLKRKIESGELRHGAALPSELELAELFSLSRITTKRALDELEREAYVDRRRGRGTHVRYRYEPKVLQAPLTGMLESLNIMGRETTVDVLSFERVSAPSAICDALKIAPNTLVDRAIRVRRNQGEAFAYYVSHTIILAEGQQALNRKSLKTQTRLEIFRQMGIKLAEVDQVLSAGAASAEVAAALGISTGSPVLVLTRTYIDQQGRTVDHLHGQYRPDRFQYHMHLSTSERRK
jgi:GntR family transcriptional regulator